LISSVHPWVCSAFVDEGSTNTSVIKIFLVGIMGVEATLSLAHVKTLVVDFRDKCVDFLVVFIVLGFKAIFVQYLREWVDGGLRIKNITKFLLDFREDTRAL
jgi:hypothetical protein